MVLFFTDYTAPLMLKTEPERPEPPESAVEAETAVKERNEEVWYVCRSCQQRITRPSDRFAVHGSHTHTFANPSGIVFEIVCFAYASGFSFMGPPSTDFSWFTGHSWRITICAACLSHVGWFFSSGDSPGFFGFILDKLLLVSSGGNRI